MAECCNSLIQKSYWEGSDIEQDGSDKDGVLERRIRDLYVGNIVKDNEDQRVNRYSNNSHSQK